MATAERTAYPKFARSYDSAELKTCFSLNEDEIDWVKQSIPSAGPRLSLAVLLKVFQHLRYFPRTDTIPSDVIQQVRASLGFSDRVTVNFSVKSSFYRQKATIRKYLGIESFYGKKSLSLAEYLRKH